MLTSIFCIYLSHLKSPILCYQHELELGVELLSIYTPPEFFLCFGNLIYSTMKSNFDSSASIFPRKTISPVIDPGFIHCSYYRLFGRSGRKRLGHMLAFILNKAKNYCDLRLSPAPFKCYNLRD